MSKKNKKNNKSEAQKASQLSAAERTKNLVQKMMLEKDLVFYKINESRKEIVIYAIVDQRQDYLNIIRGL